MDGLAATSPDSVPAEGPAGEIRPAHAGTQSSLQPVDGVTLAHYAQVSKRLSTRGYDPAAVDEVAAELGIPSDVWALARSEWDRRLATDPEVAAEFDRRYHSG
jgi:hypothetical protein